ncbi:Hypothetical_protein [Hexamita inflata]|uniref:Hypothetical_protein n=1 Tax=Hexamita inflata TaxID=28002 RepID=A0AA86NEC4_9EUKA|nr:Hypothetical protein HINF_LOCUS5842 [Hexamita inflata]
MNTKLIYSGYCLLIIVYFQCRLIYLNQQYSILFIQNLELVQKGMKSQKQTQNRALEVARLTHLHVFALSYMILQTYFSAQNESRRKLLNNFMRLYCSKVRLSLNYNFQYHKAQAISKQFQLYCQVKPTCMKHRESKTVRKIMQQKIYRQHCIQQTRLGSLIQVTKWKRGRNQRFSQQRISMENFCCQSWSNSLQMNMKYIVILVSVLSYTRLEYGQIKIMSFQFYSKIQIEVGVIKVGFTHNCAGQ